MTFDFDGLSTEQKYRLLKKVFEIAQQSFDNGDDYDFRDGSGDVNLVGVRGLQDGETVINDNDTFDDTMFVVWQAEGQPHVREFDLSTEYSEDVGEEDSRLGQSTSLARTGQYLYEFGMHADSRYPEHADLGDSDSWDEVRGHHYRALEPSLTIATILDEDHDLTLDENESTGADPLINIHYGGERESTGSWSAGCQILQGWSDYKEFIRLVEADHSIKGTANNELADAPEEDGDRSVVFTLVTGEFVEEVYHQLFGAALPVDLGEGLEVTPEAVEHAYRIIETGPGGYFPVGAEQVWHGGVHLPTPGGTDQRVPDLSA